MCARGSRNDLKMARQLHYKILRSFGPISEIMIWNRKGLQRGFEHVKDLVRGTIVAKVSHLWQAYEHFSKLKVKTDNPMKKLY